MKIEKARPVIEKILRDSLGAKESETALIFTDDTVVDSIRRSELDIIFRLFLETTKSMGVNVIEHVMRSTARHGAEPPIELWQKAFGKDFTTEIEKKFGFKSVSEKNVPDEELFLMAGQAAPPDLTIALSYFSTSHTVFRKLLNRKQCRYASMPMMDMEMFAGPLNVDFAELEKETLFLKSHIEKHHKLTVKSPSGTDLSINFSGRDVHADSGNLRQKGSFGNLPAGEVYMAPLEAQTSGRAVLEWAYWGKLNEPLELYVEGGTVIRMQGDERLKVYLEDLFEKSVNSRVIAEIGFGTNKKAKRAENLLEAEKIFGTCHIALGDNSSFGGINKAPVHLDFVIFDPEIRWLSC